MPERLRHIGGAPDLRSRNATLESPTGEAAASNVWVEVVRPLVHRRRPQARLLRPEIVAIESKVV